MEEFVAVHAGAGFHSLKNKSSLLILCRSACSRALASLASSDEGNGELFVIDIDYDIQLNHRCC